MHALLVTLLLAADCTIAPPPKPWVVEKTEAKHLRADYRLGGTRVRLFVLRADGTPAKLAALWRVKMESNVGEPTGRTVKEGTLGGRPCRTVDVRGVCHDAPIRVTWSVARCGKVAYVFWVQTSGGPAHPAGVAKIRASVRIAGEPPPQPEPREVLRFDYWKLTCVKPEGMKRITELDASETGNQCILKLTAAQDQTLCVIRVYAHRRGMKGHRTLEALVADRLAHFEKSYATREEPEQGRRWKIPLVRKARTLRLVGKRRAVDVARWFLAECKNGVQYQVEIYTAGTGADALYAPATDDFLKHFTPQRKVTRKNRG